MIDTHSHIDMLKNPDEAVKKSVLAGVEKIVVPTSSPKNFDDVINLCAKYDEIYGALGVHPEDVLEYRENTSKEIYNLAKENKKIVAIGEIGLDYYWDKTFVDVQKKVFKTQIEIANILNLPVVIHDREAHGDTFEILEQMGAKSVLMHCFSGSKEFAKRCIEKGWFIALGGVVTFKNAKKVREVAKEIPLEYIMLETDTPYLTPHPYRGEENAPKYINFVAKEIANLKDTSVSLVEKITTQNALKFFNIKENDDESTV